jgi:glycosyltransferase involved in cell wall biosynthesis
MTAEPFFSVVLPVYNQVDHLQHIVDGFHAALENLRHPFELILVVNGSADGSLQVAHRLAALHPSVQVHADPQPGWGRAVRLGLGAARGEVIAYTNSARTTPFTLTAMLLLAIANPRHVIKANRRLRHPVLRRIGSVLYNFECRSLFNLATWDINGTPKIFHRDLVQQLDLQEDGDLIDLEFIVKCERLGREILELPIVSGERHGGTSTTGVASALRLYWGGLRLWRTLGSPAPSPGAPG